MNIIGNKTSDFISTSGIGNGKGINIKITNIIGNKPILVFNTFIGNGSGEVSTDFRWLLEDGSGFWQLEDGTGNWLLEEAS